MLEIYEVLIFPLSGFLNIFDLVKERDLLLLLSLSLTKLSFLEFFLDILILYDE